MSAGGGIRSTVVVNQEGQVGKALAKLSNPTERSVAVPIIDGRGIVGEVGVQPCTGGGIRKCLISG